MEISVKAEPIFDIFGFPVTNSMLLGGGGIYCSIIMVNLGGQAG